MRKMRQKVDAVPQLRQKTPNTPGETLSEKNRKAPTAFNLNQSSAVCLPLVSGNQMLIWVHSNQIDIQLDAAAELDKAFDRFPYITQKQTAALAQRCSLHPDQVKVWFMIQRLRYGISWDYKDINSVRRKFKSSRQEEELQNRKGEEVKEDGGENKKCKTPCGKKAGEVRDKQSASKGRVMGENVRVNKRLESKIKQEQLVKKEKDRKVEEKKRNTQKKRKRLTVTDEVRKKRMKQGEENTAETAGEVEIRTDEAERKCQKSTQLETTLSTRKKKKVKGNKRLMSVQELPAPKSFKVPDEPLDAIPLLVPLSHTQACDKVNNLVVADGSLAVAQQQDSHVADTCTLPALIRSKTKTKTQLTMMKEAFLDCQYPDAEEYSRLAQVINVPRYVLVQWYGDMRYYVKKVKPRWMNEKQHGKALAHIRYRQCLTALLKTQE